MWALMQMRPGPSTDNVPEGALADVELLGFCGPRGCFFPGAQIGGPLADCADVILTQLRAAVLLAAPGLLREGQMLIRLVLGLFYRVRAADLFVRDLVPGIAVERVDAGIEFAVDEVDLDRGIAK